VCANSFFLGYGLVNLSTAYIGSQVRNRVEKAFRASALTS